MMSILSETIIYFKDSLASINHHLEGDIQFDAGWIGFKCPHSKNSKTSARYKAYSDGQPTLVLHCFKCGLKQNFTYKDKDSQKFTTPEIAKMSERKINTKLQQDEDRTRALQAMRILWDKAKPCNKHPYFNAKGLMLNGDEGYRAAPDGTLLCPIYSQTGELISLQKIFLNKDTGKFIKLFYKGLSPKNGYHVIGDIKGQGTVYFAEGSATQLTIHHATDAPVVCVFGKHFDDIGPIIAEKYSGCQLIFCADRTTSKEVSTSEDNAHKAIAATKRGHVLIPDFSMVPDDISPDIPRSDFNDLFTLLRQIDPDGGNELAELKRQLTIRPMQHHKILTQLLSKVCPIDFKKIAELAEDQNLENRHYLIITVEQLLKCAKKNNWGMCQNNDFIYLYNGAFWSLVEDSELKMFLGISAEKMGVDQYKAKYFNFRDHLFKQFLALGNLKKPTKPTNTVLINLQNGTFEINPQGTKLRPFDSLDFLTYQLPFDYAPKATAPIFHAYLDKVLPDKQKQDILAEFLGYVFIQPSRLKLEKALLLYGKGANGKSVFYEIVRSLLGEENTSEYSLQSLTDDKGYHRAMLANKLVNYASEISGKLETSVFKQLVSGEPVEARLPYGRPLNISNYAKLIFNCNELPKDVEHTDAYFRRFLIIEFNVTIPEHEQDKELANKIITNELSGVFNWVLVGLERLLAQKNFTECAAVKDACNQYKLESDSVLLFISEHGYESCANSHVLIKNLYLAYKEFCIEDGYRPVSKRNFKQRLIANKIVVSRLNIGFVAHITNTYGGNK